MGHHLYQPPSYNRGTTPSPKPSRSPTPPIPRPGTPDTPKRPTDPPGPKGKRRGEKRNGNNPVPKQNQTKRLGKKHKDPTTPMKTTDAKRGKQEPQWHNIFTGNGGDNVIDTRNSATPKKHRHRGHRRGAEQ